ncbi:MAG: hypothetical protein DRQ78_04760 [Epsilonproteobacteria bacterium]|nr:MAG: hypothetical protein DRQ78_04760 [Campylobacterota bacterium]
MKKFLLYLFLGLIVLASIFAYILYTEGAFGAKESSERADPKPFVMKCESGKCAAGKCAGDK